MLCYLSLLCYHFRRWEELVNSQLKAVLDREMDVNKDVDKDKDSHK